MDSVAADASGRARDAAENETGRHGGGVERERRLGEEGLALKEPGIDDLAVEGDAEVVRGVVGEGQVRGRARAHRGARRAANSKPADVVAVTAIAAGNEEGVRSGADDCVELECASACVGDLCWARR